jgi:hypothetical protein
MATRSMFESEYRPIKSQRSTAMNVLASVGIRAYSREKKQQLLSEVRERLPDPAVYNGHNYTDCFSVGDQSIIMQKRRDGTVELSLTCDGAADLFPI